VEIGSPIEVILSPIYHLHTAKKVFEIVGLPDDHGAIFPDRRLFEHFADFTNGIETIAAAITLHPVAEQAHGFEVILIDSDSKRGHVASSVSHEDWHDLLEIRID
jgi:hypothetical protein